MGLVGFPSVGKSTLLSKLTPTESEVASYEFTTLTAVPGNLVYKGAKIQLLDLPGIIEGANDGRGRGKQVISVAKTCDLILICLDATKGMYHKKIIEGELEGFGIRLNKKKPRLTVTKKDRGGIAISSTLPHAATNLTLDVVRSILAEYRMCSASVTLREDGTADDLIDVIEAKSRAYIPALYVMNKVDALTMEELDVIDKMPYFVPISANLEWNFEELLERIWDELRLVRVYTKPKAQMPDLEEPVVLSASKRTVEHFCNAIHKGMKENFRYAIVWGKSAKHSPQRAGLGHHLCDEDVVQIVTC